MAMAMAIEAPWPSSLTSNMSASPSMEFRGLAAQLRY